MVYGIVVLFIHSRKRRKKIIISFQFYTHKHMIDICEHVYLSIVSNTQSFHSQSLLIYLGEYRKRTKRRLKAIKCVFSPQKVHVHCLNSRARQSASYLQLFSLIRMTLSLYTRSEPVANVSKTSRAYEVNEK